MKTPATLWPGCAAHPTAQANCAECAEEVAKPWPFPESKPRRASIASAFMDGFKTALSPRAWLAWILFALGHVAHAICDCRLCERLGASWAWAWYRAYSRLMLWSADVQGIGRGPWERLEPAPKPQSADRLYPGEDWQGRAIRWAIVVCIVCAAGAAWPW